MSARYDRPLLGWSRGKTGYFLASHGVFGPDWVAVRIEVEDWDRIFDGPYSMSRHGKPGAVPRPSGSPRSGCCTFEEVQERGYLAGWSRWHFVKREHLSRMDPDWLTEVRELPRRP